MNIPDQPTIAGLRAANNALVKRHDKERQRVETFRAARDLMARELAGMLMERDRLAEDLIGARCEIDRVQAALREMAEDRDGAQIHLERTMARADELTEERDLLLGGVNLDTIKAEDALRDMIGSCGDRARKALKTKVPRYYREHGSVIRLADGLDGGWCYAEDVEKLEASLARVTAERDEALEDAKCHDRDSTGLGCDLGPPADNPDGPYGDGFGPGFHSGPG